MAKTASDKIDEVTNALLNADLSYGQGTHSPEEDAAFIVSHVCNIDPTQPISLKKFLTKKEISKIDDLVESRVRDRIPVAYLLNTSWFAGHQFFIDQRVLIPRSYFSEWINEIFSPWVKYEKVTKILDLCTGSGCIAIACAHAFEESQLLASDICDKALEVAEINIKRHNLEDRIMLCKSDIFDNIPEKFDLIVCNPPYVAEHIINELPLEFQREPLRALQSGASGLDFIKKLLSKACHHLSDCGSIIVEAGSAATSLEKSYKDIPFTWLSTETNDKALFIFSKSELEIYF